MWTELLEWEFVVMCFVHPLEFEEERHVEIDSQET